VIPNEGALFTGPVTLKRHICEEQVPGTIGVTGQFVINGVYFWYVGLPSFIVENSGINVPPIEVGRGPGIASYAILTVSQPIICDSNDFPGSWVAPSIKDQSLPK